MSLLRFRNIHEVILTLYIFLDLTFGCAICFLVPLGASEVWIILYVGYEVASWLTFKRKTLEDAMGI